MTPQQFAANVEKVVSARHGDPFSFLGMHNDSGDEGLIVRAFLPQAQRVHVIHAETGARLAALPKMHEAGLFAGPVVGKTRGTFPYRLHIETADGSHEIEDPYRFPPILDEMDVYQIAKGEHLRQDRKLGAHEMTVLGVHGVGFAVWAPNAARASVIGDFNGWDSRRHPMRFRVECGVWELFVPEIGEGAHYKFEFANRKGDLVTMKMDPFAFCCEPAPGTSSVVYNLDDYRWRDRAWMAQRGQTIKRDAPISIYEVHLGSWRRSPERGNAYLTFNELADTLVPYVVDLGFTHIQLMPVCEHTFDGSWGYEPLALFAPSSRFGRPDDFRALIDRCHQAGIGVIIDWSVAHFPTDAHALGFFDGTNLYEHGDGRTMRAGEDTGPLRFNYGRYEVADFLLNNGLFWLEEYHIDGLRVDSLASLLYLDYSRRAGEWVPNTFGGNENLEAIAFLRRFNEVVSQHHPEVATFAEERTSWPMVSRPTYLGGLGFNYRWNLRWMQDTLSYIGRDPIFRKFIHDRLTFGVMSTQTENHVLALSHNHVVQGRGALVQRMPGDRWQRFANLRVFYAFMFTHPGKKLLFMGNEFAQLREWDHNSSLDWHLLADPMHAGVQRLVGDLNRLYRETTALHEGDCDVDGFEWIDCTDVDMSVISFLRKGRQDGDFLVVVCNFTPVVRYRYRIGVPLGGAYVERLNTDAAAYGGSDVLNGSVAAFAAECHGRPYTCELTLPPLAAVVLAPRPPEPSPE